VYSYLVTVLVKIMLNRSMMARVYCAGVKMSHLDEGRYIFL